MEQMELKGQKKDENLKTLEYLQGVVGTGKATVDRYDEICDVEAVIEERIQDFIESAPKYNGNSEIMFE